MRALVTGGDGFAGRHLLAALRRAGREVHATTHGSAAGCERPDADRWWPLDVRDADAVAAVVAEVRPEQVFHLAGFAHVGLAERQPAECLAVNLGGTRALLAACLAGAPAARVLVVSSAEVYGRVDPAHVPLDEDAPVRPVTVYAWSKLGAELAAAAAAARGLDVVVLRSFNHIGPGQSTDFASAAFARQLAEIEAGRREPVLRVGNLDPVRQFADVRDTAVAYVRAADRGRRGATYNVALGETVPIRALLELLVALSGQPVRVETDSERVRPVDVPVLSGTSARLERDVGPLPSRPLRATLADVLDYWRAKLAEAPAR